MIALSSLRTLVFRVLTVVVGLALNVVIARLLGPGARGLYALATMVASICTILSANPSLAVSFRISKVGDSPGVALGRGLILGGLYSAFGVGAILVYGWFHSDAFGWLWAVTLSLPFMVFVSFINGAMLGSGNTQVVNTLALFPTLVTLLVLPFCVRAGHQGVLLAWLAGQALTAVWALWQSHRSFRIEWRKPLDYGALNYLARFGLGIAAANLLSFLNYRIDSFIVEGALGVAVLGVYSIAVTTCEFLWFISTSLGTAIYARVGQLGSDAAAKLTARAIRNTLFLVVVAGVGLYFSGPYLIPWVFGRQFRAAVRPFQILLPGVGAYSMASLLSTYFTNHAGRPLVSTILAGASMLINLGISITLIPHLGMIGGAIATTTSYVIVILIGMAYFQRVTDLNWSEILLLSPKDLIGYWRLAVSCWKLWKRLTSKR